MFIVYEGLDNTGKTTQARLLHERLVAELGDDKVLLLKEPGGSLVSQQMRTIISQNPTLPIRVQAHLFMAGIFNTYIEVIKPALAEGKIIILDRYVPSTYAYQIHTNGLYDLKATIALLPEPDLWFYTFNDTDHEKLREYPEDMDEVGMFYYGLKDKIREAYVHMFLSPDIHNLDIPTFKTHRVRSFNVNNNIEDNLKKAYDTVIEYYYKLLKKD